MSNSAFTQASDLDGAVNVLYRQVSRSTFGLTQFIQAIMKTLIGKIKAHPVYLKYHPEIVIMTPPPYSSDSKIPEAYTGGSKRVSWLATQIKNISVAEGCRCIDAYTELLPVWDKMSTDGIHLNELGQQLVADM